MLSSFHRRSLKKSLRPRSLKKSFHRQSLKKNLRRRSLNKSFHRRKLNESFHSHSWMRNTHLNRMATRQHRLYQQWSSYLAFQQLSVYQCSRLSLSCLRLMKLRTDSSAGLTVAAVLLSCFLCSACQEFRRLFSVQKWTLNRISSLLLGNHRLLLLQAILVYKALV